MFDIEGDTTVNLSTEITDHYLEDNSALQDHIAIRPKKLILKSYVGEVVFRQDENSGTFLQKAVQKLTTVSAALPALSQAAKQTKALLDSNSFSKLALNDVVSQAADYWSFVKNLASGGSKQQQAYMYFKSLMEQKILVSVQTPFEFVTSMAIESITAMQPEGSKFISDFTINLKQIRTVSELSVLQKQQFGPSNQALSAKALPTNSYSTLPDNGNIFTGRAAMQWANKALGGIIAGTIQPSAVGFRNNAGPGIDLTEQQFKDFIAGKTAQFAGTNPKSPPPVTP